jgi:hypothetical protein
MAAVILGLGWFWFHRYRQEKSIAGGRRGVLFVGHCAASASFLMYLVEIAYESVSFRNYAVFEALTGIAAALFFVGVVAAIVGKGRGRVLLVLGSLVVGGLWLSIITMRLF